MTTVRMIPPIAVRLSLSRMKRDIVQWHRKSDKRVFLSAVTALSGSIGAFIVLGYAKVIMDQCSSGFAMLAGGLIAVGYIFYTFWVADQIAEAK